MPAGMLEGEIYSLLTEVGYLEEQLKHGGISKLHFEDQMSDAKRALKEARAELAERKNRKLKMLTALFVMGG